MSHFEIRKYAFDLRLRNVFTISRSSRSNQSNIFVALNRDGTTGFGEAGPNTRYGETADIVIGYLEKVQDVVNRVNTAEEIQPALDDAEQKAGIEPVYSARLALEMAYLDWWARSQEKSLVELWNINKKTTPVTSYTIGIDEIAVMQQKIREADEYPLYKIKLGTDHDREIIKAIRQVTDKPLRIDANEGWKDLDTSKREIEFLHKQNVELVEQPMPASMNRKLQDLKKWSPLPLAADESFTGRESLEEVADSFDVINIKLNKIGSVIRSREKLKEAHALGLQVMIGCMIESSMAISAGAHVALEAEYADLDGHLLITNDPFSGLELTEDKRLKFNGKAGFGVVPNESTPF
ncbi:dipeptide epimerase [Balneola sp. MJW-20]|uniref:dipeptide epimerase n=1 Tax=Gracilimonas aurantiaca TaxID=3234185 RepID=UPI0034663081